MKTKIDEVYEEDEARKRFEAALRGALKTPHKPLRPAKAPVKKLKPKKKPGK